ncbi:MAG: HigA family addiction module antidote protein [Phycisphaerae bacterium]|nr:HigA family addiction module antidote protein [Phycisphaerae bacterium]
MSKGSTKRRYGFEPDYAVAPGETLQETIESLGMTQRDLALRTGMAPKTINEIIKGKAPITPDTAVLLERVTGVPARMWNNLETNYREQLAKIADRERLEADLDWLKTIPTKELIRRGAIEDQPDKVSLLHATLQFFGVGSSERWNEVWMQPAGAFRKSKKFRAEPGAVAAWLRLGELEAQKVKAKPFDKVKFRAVLVEIRKLTNEPPEVFEPKMVEQCASAGVAVVFVPEIKKCPTSGVARWLTSTKALIQLSLQYKTEDQFWFSFFHESGHIVNDPKKGVYIDDGDAGDHSREERANRFAAGFLIPPAYSSTLPTLTTRTQIVRFANSIGISPGIVVGRLQKEGVLPWRSFLNDLKSRFMWRQA